MLVIPYALWQYRVLLVFVALGFSAFAGAFLGSILGSRASRDKPGRATYERIPREGRQILALVYPQHPNSTDHQRLDDACDPSPFARVALPRAPLPRGDGNTMLFPPLFSSPSPRALVPSPPPLEPWFHRRRRAIPRPRKRLNAILPSPKVGEIEPPANDESQPSEHLPPQHGGS